MTLKKMWTGYEKDLKRHPRKKSRLISIMTGRSFRTITDSTDDSSHEIVIPNLDNETVLSCAEGQVNIIECILDDNEGMIYAQDQNGRTCLHHAAVNGKLKVMDTLLARGADINAQDREGKTALFVACSKGIVESVSYLLVKGADGNILNEKKYGAIHAAVSKNRINIIQELAKFPDQVNMSLKGYLGVSGLHCAAALDLGECVEILVKLGCKMCQPDDNGVFPICVASKTGSANALEAILKAGDSYGYSRQQMFSFVDLERSGPLHAAVHSGDYEVVKLCMEHGAPIDCIQSDKSTPFHLACTQGTLKIVQLMLETHLKQFPEKGIKVLFARDSLEMTPLHKAAMFDHRAVVEYLIEMGSELDALDIERRSPLLLACIRGGSDCLDVLLKAGADVTIKDKHKCNIFHFMVTFCCLSQDKLDFISSKPEGLELLNQKDSKGCTPLHFASKQGNLRYLETLLNLGACVNPKDNDQQSPLHFAARYGRFNTVTRLLNSEHGPNALNEPDGNGMTALHLASMAGHQKVVQKLLYKGALLHKDFHGRTPLHLATDSGYKQTMRLLLSFYANLLDQRDKQGNSALHYAALANQADCVDLLLTAGAAYEENDDERLPLDICIENGFVESATAFVKHERWNEALHHGSKLYRCPLLGLIQFLPEVYRVVLDRCRTKADCDQTSTDYWEKYDFGHMQLPVTIFRKVKEKFPDTVPLLSLNHMVRYGRVDLLSHPVCLQFVQMKWKAYGFMFFSLTTFLYLLFLASLTFLIITLNPMVSICHVTNQTYTETVDNFKNYPWSRSQYVVLAFLLVFLLFNFIKEFTQIYNQGKAYFIDYINYTEWLLYVSASIFAVPMMFSFNQCFHQFQWQCGAIAIFLVWFNLMLYFSKTQSVGIYVVMFLQILTTLLRVALVFSVLFIAFGLAFHTLIINQVDHRFQNPFIAIIDSILMMMGEFNFVDTYVQPYTIGSLSFPTFNFVFLVLFIVLMPVLFINLMIGLAVGDIEMVQKDAKLKRLALQVEFHTELEERLPVWFLKRVDKKEVTIYPNRLFVAQYTLISRLGGSITKLLGICNQATFKKISTMQTETRDTANDALLFELSKTKKRMKDMEGKLDKQNLLLRLIIQKMEIGEEADTFDEGVTYKPFMDATGSLATKDDDLQSPPVSPSDAFRSHVRLRINPMLAFKNGPPKKKSN